MSAGVPCGIKGDGALDLGLLVADDACSWAGAFTTNSAAAAPVLWSRRLRGAPVRALVVNSGNANACTGAAGQRAVRESAHAVARNVGCDVSEVLIASTGPIGVPLPVGRLIEALPQAVTRLSSSADDFAGSILTTDSRTKTSECGVSDARILGVAKGAAMIAPSMATMLAFLVTDAAPFDDMQEMLRLAVDRSFNRITIDGCESTNDSVFLIATGRAGVVERDAFEVALEEVCTDLAGQIVADAEGGTKVIEIAVTSAASEDEAVACARSVANSTLWRCAANGADPNWGRVVAALGSLPVSLDHKALTVSIGSQVLFDQGEPAGSFEIAAKEMDSPRFRVTCDLKRGDSEATITTVDLSTEYVLLNSEKMT